MALREEWGRPRVDLGGTPLEDQRWLGRCAQGSLQSRSTMTATVHDPRALHRMERAATISGLCGVE